MGTLNLIAIFYLQMNLTIIPGVTFRCLYGNLILAIPYGLSSVSSVTFASGEQPRNGGTGFTTKPDENVLTECPQCLRKFWYCSRALLSCSVPCFKGSDKFLRLPEVYSSLTSPLRREFLAEF